MGRVREVTGVPILLILGMRYNGAFNYDAIGTVNKLNVMCKEWEKIVWSEWEK